MVISDLEAILKPLCDTVFEQGSLAADAPYPDRFFTFWNNSSEDHKHYDNAAFGFQWDFDVNFYSSDPSDVYETLEAARTALLAAGWRVSGKGHAVGSDIDTHTGRGLTAIYLEIPE